MENLINPLDYPVCLELPLWLEETAWAGHIPFAMFLIDIARPRTIVELGTFRGVSFCAFCQAVEFLKLDAKCYAVDTWKGDEQAGLLEEEAFAKLRAYHDAHYAGFSDLIRSTFDEALSRFENNSIDLLHIDGLHTYEAVKHDFTTWLPKMSERGIILFHDTNVRENNFGVWKLWSELCEKYPHFEFLHTHGLGVLAVGSEIPDEARFLFEADERQTEILRKFFCGLGSNINSTRELNNRQKRIDELEARNREILSARPVRLYLHIKDKGVFGYAKFRYENYKDRKK